MKSITMSKRWLFLGALLAAAWAGEASAQYYHYPVPSYGYGYGYYPGPVAYDANSYLRATLNNAGQFYNLGSADAYLRTGMRNTAYFYGL